MDKDRLALLNEALCSKDGETITNLIKDYMVEIAAIKQSNSEWVKGIGMALDYLNRIKRDYRQEKLKERE